MTKKVLEVTKKRRLNERKILSLIKKRNMLDDSIHELSKQIKELRASEIKQQGYVS